MHAKPSPTFRHCSLVSFLNIFVFKCTNYFLMTFTFSFASCSSFSLKILSASKASCFFCSTQKKNRKRQLSTILFQATFNLTFSCSSAANLAASSFAFLSATFLSFSSSRNFFKRGSQAWQLSRNEDMFRKITQP